MYIEPEIKIEIAVQTHNFQRRLCWMLSSILQQQQRKMGEVLPEISVTLAYVEGNNDLIPIEQLINTFRSEGLGIKAHSYPDTSEFQYRGLTRNRALEATDADWIIFADTDMVYPTNFFGELKHLLLTDFRDSANCLHSQRFSTTLAETVSLVDTGDYPCVIDDVFKKASTLPGKLKSNIGAGYFHLANVKNLRENHGGIYINPARPRDRSWAKGQKAKSDMHFRKMLGRKAIPLPVQIHLQHVRDNEVGYHLETQR